MNMMLAHKWGKGKKKEQRSNRRPGYKRIPHGKKWFELSVYRFAAEHPKPNLPAHHRMYEGGLSPLVQTRSTVQSGTLCSSL